MQTKPRVSQSIQTAILILAIFAAGFIFGTILLPSAAQNTDPVQDVDSAFEPLWEVFNLIQTDYIDDVTVQQLVDGAITGMVDALGDQYSSYMPTEIYKMFSSDLSGDIEGIGVVIRTLEESGLVEVVTVLPNAPAESVGVRPGDLFIAVDGQSVEGLNQTELAALVRGPAGTEVTVTFLRKDEEVSFTITRAKFEVPNVEYERLDEDIAYISMAEFSSRSLEQMLTALEELNINETKGLIFDLRGNPGGLLSSAVDIASLFIPEGDPILYEVFGDGEEQVFVSKNYYADIKVPIVVLVDSSSASASELVSGALQVTDIATLIGETTFGKGTVQTIRDLSNSSGLRLTIARYLLPNRQWIHETGVTPDIEVEWDRYEAEVDAVDLQLQAAIEFILGTE
ncbi:hypothetical protein MASR2M15_19590 [Anaerolineales bacterium]